MTLEVLEIESLDLEARGVARREGKVVFVEGALPGERVLARIARRKPSFDTARTEQILKSSAQRVTPPCEYFGVCGGCAMQHLEPATQVAVKQRVLEDALEHLGKVKPARVLPPLHGPAFGYRYRARLSVRLVRKKGGVLVGFRERRGSYVADMTSCLVLPPQVSELLPKLRVLVESLAQPDRIPQIEVAVGDKVTALLLRHMEALTAADITLLRDFAERHNVSWWLQPKGPETVHLLDAADEGKLAYTLPEFGLRMPYQPTDFTQVNHAINRTLISKALKLLDVQEGERVADLFCGLGNFTLPLATQASSVVGIEGSTALTERALAAARQHGLEAKTAFSTLNLFEVDVQWLRDLGYFDRMLIDPPREGAEAVARALSALLPDERPKRIVYVSCSPATLARDAGILVHEGGYRLQSAGVINMFPHTGHVESIAVFDTPDIDGVIARAGD
ncbi:23S rRNA (uracil(1939)-C(5))-methyltransferase RlmD [Pollutimonas harenae]|uniref:23S rRNA (uracil(1939)-C(5))-methyltransferase RlmD n=1 Tax=Pollutimonas harenae TaxID=657015 RepID=A0A853H2T1_9BURK|nr:23S rRNA (uracil(1939)-C(5))-methyltransferase RlmD [Pollutimonas harenae]NYT86129.1 23S rRNA (uracil(1939)-C(5))-methyltransferase RlmD [Pollutimonas harenae]TEA71169.1 23S rRNA (uracil(1939)-C(5))-methyltransferase RlmD [Pollutimonas harenae]